MMTIPLIRTQDRLLGLDFARGLAFMGMVFVNFRTSLTNGGDDHGLIDWLNQRLDGRAAATFVILAGIGVALMSRRASENQDPTELSRVRGVLWRRSLFLFLVGLLYWPLWPADILHYYGVFLAIAAGLLTCSQPSLLLIATSLIVGFAALLIGGVDYSAYWNWKELSYGAFWTAGGFVRNLFLNGFHPVIPWLSFLLFGIWLGRLDLRHITLRRSLLVAGFALAVTSEALSAALVAWAAPSLGHDDAYAVFGTAPMPPMPLYMLAAAGTSVVIIVLCLEAADRWPASSWLRPIIATGQLALTLYVGHVVFGIVPIEVSGVLEGRRNVMSSTVCSIVFCTVAVTFAALWKQRFHHGPLEFLMRRLTDQPRSAPIPDP